MLIETGVKLIEVSEVKVVVVESNSSVVWTLLVEDMKRVR